MFEPYLDKLNNSLISHGGQLISVPKEIEKHISEKRNCTIQNWLWNVPGFRRWRVTRFDAGKSLQVLNSVAYPDFVNDKPLMGIDLLWFGMKQKLVAILDFQPLKQDQSYLNHYFDGLSKLKISCAEFSNHENMRLYDANKYFSPWVLFCRGGLEQANTQLPIVFNSFLETYWNLENIESDHYLKLDSREVEKLHIAYDIYSAERDPAHSLFTSYFGKEWSDKFLREFLFPNSSYKILDKEID